MEKIEVITWVDAHSVDYWGEKEDQDIYLCTTVGFVISENEEQIGIASTLGPDELCCCVIHIPICSIKSRKEIKEC